MTCDSCREMQDVEGAIPDCEIVGKSCLIPALCDQGQRIMDIHSMLRSLNNLVDAGTILRMCGAQIDDIKYLMVVESEIRKNTKQEKPNV